MPKIFLSYRREDSKHITGRIYDRLEAHFGRDNVFFDMEAIPFGVDFREFLDQAVGQCDILLAVISEQWLDARHRDGPRQGQCRLDDPADFVRIEIHSALARSIPVIPVLIDGARLPGESELPEGLRGLAYRNAAEVRSGRDFGDQVDRLIRGVEDVVWQVQQGNGTSQARPQAIPVAADPIAKPVAPPAVPTRREPKAGEVMSMVLGRGVEIRLAYIPPGTFLMGSPASEEGRYDDEGPQHRITLTKGFYMGIYPVTQAQWQAVMGSNPSHFKGNDRPVESVSWEDSVTLCEKLKQLTGKPFRLPAEAEWEYACSAGTTTPFYFGETISTEQANYDGNYSYGRGKKGPYRQQTMPVGQFPANVWGLKDMHGNVWEWCQDWFGCYEPQGIKDPVGQDKGECRVLRGGSWCDAPQNCRAASRFMLAPSDRNPCCGVRVVFHLDFSSPALLPPAAPAAGVPQRCACGHVQYVESRELGSIIRCPQCGSSTVAR